MKVNYTCEFCGATYDNEPAAVACEKEHVKTSEKEANFISAINEAVNVYIQLFGRFPEITLTEENEKRIMIDIDEVLEQIFEVLTGMEGEEE